MILWGNKNGVHGFQKSDKNSALWIKNKYKFLKSNIDALAVKLVNLWQKKNCQVKIIYNLKY